MPSRLVRVLLEAEQHGFGQRDVAAAPTPVLALGHDVPAAFELSARLFETSALRPRAGEVRADHISK